MTGIAAARFVHGIMLGCACGAFPGVRAGYKLAFPAAWLSAFFGEPVPYRMPFAWYHVWLSPACILHPTEKEGQMGLVVPLSSFYLEAMVIIFQVSLSLLQSSPKKGASRNFLCRDIKLYWERARSLLRLANKYTASAESLVEDLKSF